jgi:SOS-response transcriptional repressor LexA
MTASLTRKQAQALRFAGAFIASHGYPPTYAELCEGCGLSKWSRSGMHYRVRRLRELGYLIQQEGRVRQVIILSDTGRAYCKAFPGYTAPVLPGARQQSQHTNPPCAASGTVNASMGQGRRAGIHFRPVEGEA